MMNGKLQILGILFAILLAGCAGELAGPVGDKGGDVDSAELEVAPLGSADSANSVHQGRLTLNELTIAELTRRYPYHVWTFDLEDDSDVFIDLANRDGEDTFQFLYVWSGSEWSFYDLNDDCPRGDTLNSCWEGELLAGDYALIATSYAYAAYRQRWSFEYHLTVWAEPSLQACGSRGLEPCPVGEYCDWNNEDGTTAACGANDAPGVCRPIPDICPAHYAPVCGCDGRNYSSPCYAALNGIDVSSVGECPNDGQGEGETCAGIASLECASGLVCDFSENVGCHIADMGGVCVPEDRPINCTEEYAPVCGCDGVTYDNDCFRRVALVAFDHRGACRNPGHAEGEMCGGIAGFTCADGLRCDHSANEGCDIMDMAGTCVRDEPVICTLEYWPVCGCDGRTYGNNCARRAAGVPLDHIGECRTR